MITIPLPESCTIKPRQGEVGRSYLTMNNFLVVVPKRRKYIPGIQLLVSIFCEPLMRNLLQALPNSSDISNSCSMVSSVWMTTQCFAGFGKNFQSDGEAKSPVVLGSLDLSNVAF